MMLALGSGSRAAAALIVVVVVVVGGGGSGGGFGHCYVTQTQCSKSSKFYKTLKKIPPAVTVMQYTC